MPRRNHRDPHRPIQIEVPAPIVITPKRSEREWIEEREYRAIIEAGQGRARDSLKKQEQAAIAARMDWSVCLVTGCTDTPALRLGLEHLAVDVEYDPAESLPLCLTHLTVAWKQLQRKRGTPEVIESVDALNQKLRDKAEREAAEEQARYLADSNGEIYFLRQNGLIKVGWSRCLYDRLKAYGPNVELLCHYHGSRTDETNLHRQLRPALAKGREWYHDGDVIALFLEQALAKHGPPTKQYDWTAPKEAIKQRKRVRY